MLWRSVLWPLMESYTYIAAILVVQGSAMEALRKPMDAREGAGRRIRYHEAHQSAIGPSWKFHRTQELVTEAL